MTSNKRGGISRHTGQMRPWFLAGFTTLVLAGPSLAGAQEQVGRAVALPSLTGLFSQALDHDAELAQQRLELRAVEQEAPMALSRLLPQASATGGYLWQDSTNIQTDPEDVDLDQTARRPGEIEESYWRLEVSQPLFSLERWHGLDRADAQVAAAGLDVALVERELALAVSEAYVRAFLAACQLGLLEAQQAALALQVQQAQRAFDLGVRDRITLLEATSRLDEVIADTVEARNAQQDAESELQRLTGLRPRFDGQRVGDLTRLELADAIAAEDDWLTRVGNNLEVQRALAERRLRDIDIRLRRSGYAPEVYLNLSYSDRNSDDAFRESEDYRAGVEVSVPLFRGGYTRASVRQAELREQSSQRGVDHRRNLAGQEVRRALRALEGSVRRLAAQEQAIESGRLFLEAAERGETLGLRDLVDVLDAQARLYDLRIQFVDTIGRYVLDRLALESAVGDLGSRDLAWTMALLVRLTEG